MTTTSDADTGFTNAVSKAKTAIRDLFEPTPLQKNQHLSMKYGAEIWLKREDLTPVRSYKLRGAYNAMDKYEGDSRHFVCASAGNHAQGVAYACRHFGVRGTIFMPVTTPGQKIDKTRVFGGGQVEIKLVGDVFDEALAAAQEFCAEQGAKFLSPFDDADVVEGQATVGAEILEQIDGPVDLVVLPVGGGGLAAGVTRLFSEASPQTGFAFAEPSGGASLKAALQAAGPVTLDRLDNFVDGAAVARIGALPFKALSAFSAGQVYIAPEDRVSVTMLEMLNAEGIVLEPAGALSIDVLRDLGEAGLLAGKRVVCVVSGGNFDFNRLPDVRERAARWQGVKKYFILRLPQRPGALREFLDMLGPKDDVARFEYLKKSARDFGTVLLGVETDTPENLDVLLGKMDDAGYRYRDITNDEILAEFLI